MMKGMKITSVQVSYEAACLVLTTAVDAGHTYGFGYWAELLECKSNPQGVVYGIKLKDFEGTKMIVSNDRDKEGEGWVRQQAIATAIEQMLMDPVGTEAQSWVAQLLNEEEPDGPLAEAIVQVACFGKVIYG